MCRAWKNPKYLIKRGQNIQGIFDAQLIGGHPAKSIINPIGFLPGLFSHLIELARHTFILLNVGLQKHFAGQQRVIKK